VGRDEGLRGRKIEQWPREGFDVPDFTLVPRPGGIPAPTLVVPGENRVAPLAAVPRVVDALPGSCLAVLAGAGQLSHPDAPEGLTLRDYVGCEGAQEPPRAGDRWCFRVRRGT